MQHSTKLAKPKKPRPDFPLFPHASGRWCKKVRGKLAYFGYWRDDPKGAAALALWLDQKDDLLAGRMPRSKKGALTVKALCNTFLTFKEGKADAGEITRRTFQDYYEVCEIIIREFGKNRLVEDIDAGDFGQLWGKLSKRLNPTSVGNLVQRTRSVFIYAYKEGLIDRPVPFGSAFKKPEKRILRAIRQRKGPRLIPVADLRTILAAADPQMKAMILLGLNCGFGNNDVGTLRMSSLDLESGWVSHPRPKTAVERRCPLWPETVQAIREAIAVRPKAKDRQHDDLVFLTKYGQPWSKDTKANPVSAEFRKLVQRVDVAARAAAIRDGGKVPVPIYRPGCTGFYSLRRAFETVGGEVTDQVAVDALMGHVDGSMAAHYREAISDDRLVRVVDHVHSWLFPEGGSNG